MGKRPGRQCRIIAITAIIANRHRKRGLRVTQPLGHTHCNRSHMGHCKRVPNNTPMARGSKGNSDIHENGLQKKILRGKGAQVKGILKGLRLSIPISVILYGAEDRT